MHAVLAALGTAVLSAASQAQAALPVGMVDEPCGQARPKPAAFDRLTALVIDPGQVDPEAVARILQAPDVAAYVEAEKERSTRDWPNLCRYHADNAAAIAAKAPPRIVFMGDSITENWFKADPALFTNGVIGRGISGQTTPQMLVRFHADVVALRPRIVHILAGTNDIAGNTGPTSVQDYKNNIMAMVEIAKFNGIEVILGSIPPALQFPWRRELSPAPRIAELNAWLRDYARNEGIGFVDYHSALVGQHGELRSELGNDGVHPNRNGYAIMRPLVRGAIARIEKAGR